MQTRNTLLAKERLRSYRRNEGEVSRRLPVPAHGCKPLRLLQVAAAKRNAQGAEIIQDNVQDTIFGGFAPNSQTAEVLSKTLGSRTVMSGYISRGKNDPSQTLQMVERPLMTPDELKSIPKGQFIVMKTGTHPMRTRLRLFLDWGITFGESYVLPERAARKVAYASKQELEAAILGCHSLQQRPQEAPATPATTPKNRTQGREQEEWEKLGPSTSIKGLKKPGGEAT